MTWAGDADTRAWLCALATPEYTISLSTATTRVGDWAPVDGWPLGRAWPSTFLSGWLAESNVESTAPGRPSLHQTSDLTGTGCCHVAPGAQGPGRPGTRSQ